ncbi:hypothetical protein FJZ31_00130 [Candidatus Poribacteria bacterium]|nr:hypothetical protein [Candidatus Poribacteria bacterium]
MAENKRDPLPKPDASIEEIAEFWDTHSLADYWDVTKEVEFEVDITKETRWIELDEEIAKKVYEVAKRKNIPVQILVNSWVNEKAWEDKIDLEV